MPAEVLAGAATRLTFFCLLWLAMSAHADQPNYFLVTYSPGSSWNEAISYEEQPGLKAHHEYVRQLHREDQVVMAGSVTDINEPFVSLLLLQTSSQEEAERLASHDPGVQMRLIRFEVIPWHVSLSSMRHVQRRPAPVIDNKDQSFSIKRVDPASRLNLEDRLTR